MSWLIFARSGAARPNDATPDATLTATAYETLLNCDSKNMMAFTYGIRSQGESTAVVRPRNLVASCDCLLRVRWTSFLQLGGVNLLLRIFNE